MCFWEIFEMWLIIKKYEALRGFEVILNAFFFIQIKKIEFDFFFKEKGKMILSPQ